MKINLNEYIDLKKHTFGITDSDFDLNITRYLVSNDWFGAEPDKHADSVLIDESGVELLEPKIDAFIRVYNRKDIEKVEMVFWKLKEALPKTAELLKKYRKSTDLEGTVFLRLADFIYACLPGELDESTDREIAEFMDDAFDELPHGCAAAAADFINWTHENIRTVYKNLYFINNYTDSSDRNSAYDPSDYLNILYHLYNEEYINENDMYAQAAESKNYADTWLYLSLHFLCALRNTDLVRIPHPRLADDPENILKQIADNTFPDESARLVIYSVIWELNAFMLTPNKTSRTTGVAAIKLHIPESVEVHMGKLFALAEAHFRLENESSENPLVRVITSYEQINRYMGEDIGDLFLESNFHSRAANKSYMQMIYLLTDDILGANDEFNVKGYMLAALARSHKGSYGDFARTTGIYLKDAKMSGYTPEFVAKELFERGVLSVIPSMLLKMIVGEDYNRLSVESQTKMIQELDMSPVEVERAVSLVQKNVRQSSEMVKTLYGEHSKEELLTYLHRIGNGQAVSKTDSCMCLMTAMGKVCPYPGHTSCPSCRYEISTKTTMLLMVREVKRLQDIYRHSTDTIERQRCMAMVKDIVAPGIEEMLSVMEEVYGHDAVQTLEAVITGEN